jgi:hypothetical protein
MTLSGATGREQFKPMLLSESNYISYYLGKAQEKVAAGSFHYHFRFTSSASVFGQDEVVAGVIAGF